MNSVVFLICGLAMVAFSGYVILKNRRLVREGIRTMGVVTSQERRQTTSERGVPGVEVRPVFDFTGQDGRQHRVTSPVSHSGPQYQVGQSVPVVYMADTPEKARIHTGSGLWTGPIILGGIGLVCLLIGLVGMAGR